jgi:hypothetical protein
VLHDAVDLEHLRADRLQRLARGSDATTAKPLPASPARAASTPAFRASRLVWKAISSMTPMIWVIWRDEASISPMAATAWLTTSPDFSASPRAAATMPDALLALSAAPFTVVVSSSRAAAVSSRPAACCSVRRDKSSDAEAIWSEPLVRLDAASAIAPKASARLSRARLKSSAISA